MKILNSFLASILIATSFFATSVYASADSQIVSEQQLIQASASGGGRYHECFLAGNPGCKK